MAKKKLPHKEVLELGCGNGKTLSSILAQKPKKVVALDFSEKAIELAKKKLSKQKKIVESRY
jgi:2-polyprenyl-3-methyl-5-hydroxy-6-metoxy-1,4-benzoquinol methylase